MVENAAAAETSGWRAFQETLKIADPAAGGKEELPVENLREQFEQIDESHFAANAQNMVSMNPGNCIDKIVVVLFLVLVGLGSRAELESGSIEREFVHVVRQIVRGTVNAQGRSRRPGRRRIDGRVVDMHQTKAQFVHQFRRKQMRLGDSQEAVAHRERVGKVQVGSRNRAPERRLQAARAKRFERFRIGIEKAFGDFVVSAMEFAVPVRRELIVCIFSGLADRERDGRTRLRPAWLGRSGVQKSAGPAAKLVALGVKDGRNNRIDTRYAASSGQCTVCRRVTKVGGYERNRRADKRSGRETAALTGPLVVHKEESKFLGDRRTAETETEQILPHHRAFLT